MAGRFVTEYKWESTCDTAYTGQKPASNHLPAEAGDKQKTLLNLPYILLKRFETPAKRHKLIGEVFQKLAKALDKLRDACETHQLGCAGVAPPKQKIWMTTYAPEINKWAKLGAGTH